MSNINALWSAEIAFYSQSVTSMSMIPTCMRLR